MPKILAKTHFAIIRFIFNITVHKASIESSFDDLINNIYAGAMPKTFLIFCLGIS